VQQVEFASLEELANRFQASVSTVRRDLTALEARGVLKRTHGGARLTTPPRSDEFIFSARYTHQLDEKEVIGRTCAEIIQPNQTVIIDAGTTCFHVARHLEAKTPHLITNSLPVANHFSAAHKLEVVVSGGVIYPRLGVLVGPLAVGSFKQVHADVAIMSCGGISVDGVMNSHGLLIEIQRVMMQAARRVVLCVDHTKFGRQSISRLCDLAAIDTIVSDQPPSPEIFAALQQAGVEIILATPDGPRTLQPGDPKSSRRISRAESLLQSQTPSGEAGTAPAQPSPADRPIAEPGLGGDDKFID
jgi:DeoR/GlpR family transcriptional regulator of sugar metabolism